MTDKINGYDPGRHEALQALELLYMEELERTGRLSERKSRNLRRVQSRLIAIEISGEIGEHRQHAPEPLRTART